MLAARGEGAVYWDLAERGHRAYVAQTLADRCDRYGLDRETAFGAAVPDLVDHAVAVTEARVRAEAAERIASLEAEVKGLRPRAAAASRQPPTTGGGSAPGGIGRGARRQRLTDGLLPRRRPRSTRATGSFGAPARTGDNRWLGRWPTWRYVVPTTTKRASSSASSSRGFHLAAAPEDDQRARSTSIASRRSRPGVSWRDVNNAYPESTGVIAPRIESTMIVGGDIFLDNALLRNQRTR